MLGELLPTRAVGPQLALSLAYAAATSGHPDRVAHWLDLCDERIAADTVVAGWRSARAAALMMRALSAYRTPTPHARSNSASRRSRWNPTAPGARSP